MTGWGSGAAVRLSHALTDLASLANSARAGLGVLRMAVLPHHSFTSRPASSAVVSSSWNLNSFLAVHFFTPKLHVLSYFILKHRRHNMLPFPPPPKKFLRLPSSIEAQPYLVLTSPGPGYVVQRCLRLHYCRKVACHFQQYRFC